MEGERDAGDDKSQKPPEHRQREQALRDKRRERGLNNPAMVDVFATWVALCGTRADLDPLRIAQWPAWFRDDMRFMMAELAYGREEEDRKKKAKTPPPPAPAKPTTRRGVRRR